MLALSIKQPWAELIAQGEKTEEYRSRVIRYRGDLLIVASRTFDYDSGTESADLPRGVMVCIVSVVGCHETDDGYAWELANPRRVEPIAVRGSQGFFHVPDNTIEIVVGAAPRLRAPATRPPAHNPRVKRGPYTFQQDDRRLRGHVATTMEEARGIARKLADELGDYVYIMRDGINVGGEWHAAERLS